MGAVIDAKDQDVLWRAVALGFSNDDCSGHRVMRVRMVTANPVIQVHRTIAAIQQDVAHSIDAISDAILSGFTQLCTIKVGPLDKNTGTGPNC